MNDDDIPLEREGYRVFVEPLIGLTHLFMTSVTAWVVLEILSTEHGRKMVVQLPSLIKTTFHTYI